MSETEKPKRSKTGAITNDDDYTTFNRAHATEAAELVVAALGDITNLLPVSLYGAAARRADTRTILKRVASEGLPFLTVTLPKLWAGLAQYIERGHGDYPSFKTTVTGHPVFLQGLFRLIYKDTAYRATAIALVYQISVIFTKLKGPYPKSVLRKQLADFVQTDKELASIDLFNEVNLPLLEQARIEVEALMKGFSMETCIPRPGPGATNTPVEKHMRYRPYVLYTKIHDVLPYWDWFTVHPWDVVDQTSIYLDMFKRQVLAPRARFKFVHKKVGKARGICIEQNEAQFLQQAVKHGLYEWVESHPLTRGRIAFSDQSINANLALLFSKTGQGATIDMSEASNRVLRDIVSWFFQNTCLHNVLMALSTPTVDFPKEFHDIAPSLDVNMYAPMGSGLCFPIMTIVHWALIRAIIHCSMYDNILKRDVYVYGDDIVLPSQVTEAVYTYLPRFGMKINEDKSFYRSHFRESCGLHAYDGIEITPTYVKNLAIDDPRALMSCILVETQFFERGFTNVASFLREKISRQYPNLPTTSLQSPELGFKRTGTFTPLRQVALKVRKNAYGEPVSRVQVLEPVQDRLVLPSERERYLRHVLTSDNTPFIGGSAQAIKIAWRTVHIAQLDGYSSADNILGQRINYDSKPTEPSCGTRFASRRRWRNPGVLDSRLVLWRRNGGRVARYPND